MILSETLRPQDVEVSYTYLSGYQSVGCLKTVIEFLVALTAGSGRTTRQYRLRQENFFSKFKLYPFLEQGARNEGKMTRGCLSLSRFNLKNSADSRFS